MKPKTHLTPKPNIQIIQNPKLSFTFPKFPRS